MNARLYGKRTGTTINDVTTLGTTNTNNDTNTPTPFIKDWPSLAVTSSPINDDTTKTNFSTTNSSFINLNPQPFEPSSIHLFANSISR